MIEGGMDLCYNIFKKYVSSQKANSHPYMIIYGKE